MGTTKENKKSQQTIAKRERQMENLNKEYKEKTMNLD